MHTNHWTRKFLEKDISLSVPLQNPKINLHKKWSPSINNQINHCWTRNHLHNKHCKPVNRPGKDVSSWGKSQIQTRSRFWQNPWAKHRLQQKDQPIFFHEVASVESRSDRNILFPTTHTPLPSPWCVPMSKPRKKRQRKHTKPWSTNSKMNSSEASPPQQAQMRASDRSCTHQMQSGTHSPERHSISAHGRTKPAATSLGEQIGAQYRPAMSQRRWTAA
jgi:hypothetical protein